MNILFVYPLCPDSFWSFRHDLHFISKKAVSPPLGLITVSAMIPGSWKKKLIDMNVSTLTVKDIQWADYVFISAMYIQKKSVDHVLGLCKAHNTKVVAGGPLFTQEYKNYPQIDHFVLNEAEITLPLFLNDLNASGKPKKIYQARKNEYADLTMTPIPDYHLLHQNAYAFMSLQISRGCPYGCDFCEITSLLGRKVRMKTSLQVLREFDRLYELKWRGSVSIVDDNFIGRKREVRDHLLPTINTWMKAHGHPFTFNIQASIDLADDDKLLSGMAQAGFHSMFIGIETPVEESLNECHKSQNKKRDMLEDIRKIQKAGMLVSGGFIIGFDSDQPSVFQKQINFIQNSGIASAMVGLLNAPKNTKLYHRLEKEGRISDLATGNNTDFTLNFRPLMDKKVLLEGFEQIIQNIYSVKSYYQRVKNLLENYHPPKRPKKINPTRLLAFLKTIIIIGIAHKGRSEYWKLLFWTLTKKPSLFMEAVTLAVYGHHFRRVYGLI